MNDAIKWIAVEDSLPEPDVTVRFMAWDGTMWRGFYAHDLWWTQGQEITEAYLSPVTHWAPYLE